MINAKHSYVIGFDNLSKISDWFSDSLCRLTTGSGFATRKLYTNEKQIIFSARRPIILNGIEDLASRGDLLDRMILLRLRGSARKNGRSEREFWIEFERACPQILGSLFDAVSVALHNRPNVKLSDPPRMSDFAVIGCAAEEHSDSKGAFISAYHRNSVEAHLQRWMRARPPRRS